MIKIKNGEIPKTRGIYMTVARIYPYCKNINLYLLKRLDSKNNHYLFGLKNFNLRQDFKKI